MRVVAIELLVSRVKTGLDEVFSTLNYDHFVHSLTYALVHIPTYKYKIWEN